MNLRANYHTHTFFSDGKADIEKFIAKAKEENIESLGFTEHAPVPFETEWAMSFDKMAEWNSKMDKLKKEHAPDLRIFKAMEIDYIPGLTIPFDWFNANFSLDYIIGSVHIIKSDKGLWFIDGPDEEVYIDGIRDFFDNDPRKAMEAFYIQQIEMVKAEKFQVLGHFDKIKMHNKERFFSTNDPLYKSLAGLLLDEVKKRDIIVEINTRGIYKGRSEELFPSHEWIRECLNRDIPLMVNSDAHHPDEIYKLIPETVAAIKDIGVKELCFFEEGGFVSKRI